VTHVFLHATGDSNAYNNFYFNAGGDWEKYIENQIWVWHTYGKDVGDIGYHYIIDPNGVIYEGRLTTLEMVNDPSYYVKGAHLIRGNKYAVGIVLLSLDGDFSVEELTHHQLESLVELSVAIFKQQGIDDPREEAEFYSELYYRIEGHRTWVINHGGYRDCPGENIYNRLMEIRNLVYNKMHAIEDSDEDLIPDEYDNCPDVSNSDQADWNMNGIGDVCEDLDNDGVIDLEDNCINVSNPFQEDEDNDGIGDECDNCTSFPNTNQFDMDGDGEGDECDNDIDGDGIDNVNDNCADYYNPNQEDADSDGEGDACQLDSCNTQNAIDQVSAMHTCLAPVCNVLDQKREESSEEIEFCKQTLIESTDPFVLNFYIYNRSATINNGIMVFPGQIEVPGCVLYDDEELYFDEATQQYVLTEEQLDSIYACLEYNILEGALAEGYDPAMPLPNIDSYDQFLNDLCACKDDLNEDLNDIELTAGIDAMQCFTATALHCSQNKPCIDRSEANQLINNSNRPVDVGCNYWPSLNEYYP
jgi:hypothetical protein|tara:strand:- start:17386 stop:18972 length:1587 start_codon:yes stop_codon:yes gene_type:complete